MAYIGRSPTLGNYQKLDDFSASFNGVLSTFSLTVGGQPFLPGTSTALLVSLGGVVQEPVTSYTVENDQINFATPPAAATDLFIISLGTKLDIAVPADGSVTPVKLSNGGPSWNSSGDVAISGVTTITTSAGTVSVGVGTTALLVEGNARVTGILTVGTSSITLDGTNNNINVGSGVTISSPASNEFAISTNGSERVRVGAGGSIGIGTDNPTKALHISQNSDVAIRMHAGNCNTNARSWEVVVGGNASNNAEMVFRTRQDDGTGGSEIARFTTGGDLKFPSGGGIDFSATSDGSGTTTSELLDDYEEGTWTPSGSYTFSHATYTKIGRQVFCQFTCTNPSGMGQIGLPFAPSNNVTGSGIPEQVRYVGDVQFFVSGGNDDSTYKYIWQGNIGASMYLHKLSGAGAQSWTATFGSNVSQVTAFITYIVA